MLVDQFEQYIRIEFVEIKSFKSYPRLENGFLKHSTISFLSCTIIQNFAKFILVMVITSKPWPGF